MATDDKVVVAGPGTLDDNINTRDQRRVGIWFLVVTLLTVWGLMSLGDSHAPRQTAEQAADTSGTDANLPVDENPPGFSVNRPAGIVEWPGHVGQHPKYLTGTGNSPAQDTSAEGTSTATTTNTATATTTNTSTNATPPPAAH